MTKPAILLVDDDAQVLRAIARDVRQWYGQEYRILRAEGGPEGLSALEELTARSEPVALVLSDQRMPRADGVKVLARTRELFPETKRVLLTAYADTDAAIAAINESQIDHYLMKPWDPPEERLYPVLDDLLADWQAGYHPPFDGVRVVGDRWSAETYALKDFLARNRVPYMFLDIETSREARELVAAAGDGAALPCVVLPDGERLDGPTPMQLAARVGLPTQVAEPFYDLVIVGAGPAGLAAAVYGGSEGLRTIMIEQEAPGGQAGMSSRIENYLGFPSGLSGADLARRGLDQTRRFGVEVVYPRRVCGIRVDGPYKTLQLADGGEVACHVLMLAMGVSWRLLPARGAASFTGRGVYYGSSMTEAMSCRDEVVCVVGAGNSAGQAAVYFATYARRVVMLVRGESLGSRMSRYLVERIERTPNIDVRLHTEVAACDGESRLERLTFVDVRTGRTEDVDAHFLFVFIGAAPHTEWLDGLVARDARGFVLTGPDLDPERDLKDWPLERPPFLLEANVPGIFAAGDVRHESVKRVASAVGEGSVGIYFMHRYLASL